MVWYDYYYFILVVPALIISLIAQAKVKSAYSKYAKVGNSRNLTGAQAARMILDSHGLTYVPINVVQGELPDHFNPTDNYSYHVTASENGVKTKESTSPLRWFFTLNGGIAFRF